MQDRTHRSTRTHCGVCILSLKMLLVLGFINLILAQQTLCEMYTSVVNVQQAIAVEKELLKYLNSYIEDETLRLNDLKRFYGKVSNLHANVFQGAGTAMANPLFAYTLIKRLQSEWLNVVYSNEANENTQAFKSGYEKEESRLPKFEDLQGAAKGLMRLQDVYALSVKGLVNGLFQRDTAGGAVDIYRAVNSITLSGDDCFLIGKVAYEMEDYYHSVLWLEPAASLFRRAYRTWNTEDEGSLEDVLDHLAFSHFKTGNVSYALSLSREILHLDPSNKRVTRNIEKYEKILAASPANSDVLIQRPNTTYLQTRNTYEWLCQTLGSQPRHYENPRLHCDFHTNSNPALVLKPMRREVVSLQPYVVLYHSFISDHEAKTIKEFSAPGLQRSVVASGVKQSTVEYRISKSAWLKDTAHPVVQKLDQRIAALTGLNVHPPYAEYLQVVNYGIGGHYEPHFDHATSESSPLYKLNTGNRVATFMIYLNSVEAGGSTAFISANFSVPVVKNAALFWWNLHRNGKGNGDTLHAGCPVLVGDKWVANKWVHEFGQEFQRRCSPNPDD
ncbi:prolyl 4-hydroxylase subunit alpha-3-like [Acipenser ruthenus]|uniref:prolyl 4-hydroxylase subunit alpha-3-like n=1 Tax=Acipenser ruthenus TaxID=7906 RepID=UPI0027410E12|nr:prolyl 4-hydroxylase subunit alpha-3-like [Acipenser ruthenus]